MAASKKGLSITQRWLDLAYLSFLAIHIPVALGIDLGLLYPEWLKPEFTRAAHESLIRQYNDRLFANPPSWYLLFISLEALYHIPVSLWLIPNLFRDTQRGRVSLHLLLLGAEITLTTLACMAEQWFDPAYSPGDNHALIALYASYMVLPIVMVVDGFNRVTTIIDAKDTAESFNEKKGK